MSSSRFVDNLHFFEGQPSATLEDLFRRVGDAHSDRKSDDSPPHCAVELEEEISSTTTSLPPPFVLKFTNLTYTIKTPTNKLSLFPSFRNNRLATAESIESALNARKKTVLGSISGEARDGEIMAVLGASGSGKSTLIDALAGRISRASLQGSVTLNGEDLLDGRHLLKTISAYVMQDDLLYPMLTVEETLMFAAEFRLPRSLSHSKKKARVQVLIDQLGLRAAANTVIGDEGHRGVSGGERRRVSIGTDIIHDPIVLFLDEPTSGLDSTSAFMVVKVLQRIARNGSVVVLSIHQPSFRILGLLDRLLFLSRGKTVYGGTPDGLHPFFAEFGHRIPDNENPAEFALDHIRELESTPSGAWPLVEFNNSRQLLTPSTLKTPDVSLKDAIAASISRGKLVSGGSASGSAFPAPSFANPFWVEMAVLSRRAFTNSRRLPELFCMRLGAVVVTGFILATIFWRLDDSPRGARERLGFFAIAMSTMFYTCADALPVFLEERYIYLRETAYNAYRRSSYVLSNAAVGVPSLALLSIAFTCTTFFAVGLAGGAQGFFYFFLIVFASFWAGSGFVTFLSGVVSHVMLGYTVVVAILAYFLLFSGFFIDRTRIPNYWIWFHYLSLVKYPYEGVLLNEFGEGDKCFARGTEMFDGSPLGSLPDATKAAVLKAMGAALGVNLTVETCVTTGADLLKQEAITQMGKWGCLCVTAAWGFLFRILFYFALMMRSNNKRK